MNLGRDDTDVVLSAMDNLRRIVRALRVSAHSAEHTAGLSGAQLFVLSELAAEPGASLVQLAARTSTDPSSVSVVVARLVDRGLVSRGRDPADGRRASLVLTDEGEAMLAKAPEPVQGRMIAALRGMAAAQVRNFAESLTVLVDRLDLADAPPPMFFEDEPRQRARRGR